MHEVREGALAFQRRARTTLERTLAAYLLAAVAAAEHAARLGGAYVCEPLPTLDGREVPALIRAPRRLYLVR